MQRRKYIGALGSAVGALLAGCLSSNDNSDPENQTDADNRTDDETGTDTASDNDTFAGPVALSQTVVDAASQGDVDRFTELLHPLNPVSNMPEDEISLGTLPANESTITLKTQDPSVETVYQTISRAERTLSDKESQLQDALENNAAIVTVSLQNIVQNPDRPSRVLWVVAPNQDGQLRLLFQGVPVGLADLPGISTQVITNIAFDIEAGVARLELPSEPPAGELSVRTGATRDSFNIGPEQQETPTISLANDGGELAIDFRQDDEVVPLHRELYGDQRVVNGITIEQTEQVESNRVQVTFTDQFDADEITLTSTRLGATTTAGGGQANESESGSIIENIDMLSTSIAPRYDELIVGRTSDGDKEEVHRERLYYER